MPLSSRNFVISAIPFLASDRDQSIEYHETILSRDFYRTIKNSEIIIPLLVFSSSFLNGSFCPELITGEYSIRESAEWARGLTSFCFENSSTIQFINSVKLRPHNFASFYALIAQSRYFSRQMIELNQATDFSATSNSPLRNLNALRKLTLTTGLGRSTNSRVPPDFDNLFDQHLSRLHNLEELKIISVAVDDDSPIPSAMLKRIWATPNNPMRYLTNFEIELLSETDEIDLSVISDAQPKLQKLRVNVKKKARDLGVTTTILPPHLAVLDDLRELSLEIHVPQLRVAWDQFFRENDDEREQRNYYCPYLTHVTFSLHVIDSSQEDMTEHFIEKLDGSYVTHAAFSGTGGVFQQQRPTDYSEVEVLTRKFPRLAKLHVRGDRRRGVVESLKLVGQRLTEGSLMEGLSIDQIAENDDADEGFQYLFDPTQAIGGCYKSLTSLRASPGGSRGFGWFGGCFHLNQAFIQKQFVLRSLHLDGNNTTFCVQGFNQILLAFSHCLEELTVPAQFSPKEFIPFKEIQLQKMTRLHTLHIKMLYSSGRKNTISAGTFGRIVALCPKLQTLTMCECTDKYIEEFCDNYIESESKMLEIDVKEFPAKMFRWSWDRLAKIASLRKIQGSVNEAKLSPLEEDEEASIYDEKVSLRLLVAKFRQERPDVRVGGF